MLMHGTESPRVAALAPLISEGDPLALADVILDHEDGMATWADGEEDLVEDGLRCLPKIVRLAFSESFVNGRNGKAFGG